MTVRFLLIRHAAHVHLDRHLSGRMPGVPLSDDGRAQAARLGEALAGETIDGIVASPLERTQETAKAIANARSVRPTIETDDALVEIDMGAWTGAPIGGFGDDPQWQAWNAERGTARIPGGETMAEATARIVGCLERLARNHAGETIALVSHSDMIRAVAATVIGLSLQSMLRFEIAPASLTRIDWGDWGTRLISLNERIGEWPR